MGFTPDAPPHKTSCPFLGLPNDSDTRYGFPSPGNHCHRFSPPASITREYQQTWCLSGAYPECRVFQEANEKDLPDGLALQPKGLQSPRNRTLVAILLVIVITLLCIGSLINGRVRSQKQALAMGSTMTQSAAREALTKTVEAITASAPTVTPTPTPTFTRTATPTVTPKPKPSSTSTPPPPTEGPGLETEFGSNPRFLIHQVKVGESIRNIARVYETSPTLISAINQFIAGASIRPDMFLVIIPGRTEYPGMPVFQSVYLEEDTTVSELSALYEVSSDELRRYNGFWEGELVPAKRWIIVPLSSASNP